jgi:predicted metal-binding protein
MTNDVEGSLGRLVDEALELGIEKTKVIATDTISVGRWVQWKCQYGCSFYKKDDFHRPGAPDVEEMKEVIQEYDKALLLNGSNGTELSKMAIELESIAVDLGYYKAFALISLPFGGNST